MTTQDQHAVIKAALFEAQRLVKAVSKDATNDHHKYNYASADAIITEARTCLHEVGLAVLPVSSAITMAKMSDTDDKGVIFEWTQERLDLTFEVFHAASGTSMAWPPFSVAVIPERGRPLDKAEAGARTYAMSYFLRELLMIPRTGADDRDGQHDEGGRGARSGRGDRRRETQPPSNEARRAPAPDRRREAPPEPAAQKPAPSAPDRRREAPPSPTAQKPAPSASAPATAEPSDPRDIVARLLSAIHVLDGQLGEPGQATSAALDLLGGKKPADLDRAEAVRLIGGRDTPGPLRALRDRLKAAAAAQ